MTMSEMHYRLRSVHLGNERSIWVRGYGPSVSNLTIFLDAELYRERVGAGVLLDELSRSGAIAPSLFVFVSVESVTSRWRECPCYPPFARFIDEELFPWLEALRPEVRQAQERVVVGLSYTGLAAAYVALNAPERFTKVIAQSGSFWWNDCWLASQVAQPLTAEFYLDVGLEETQTEVQHSEDVLQVISQIEGVRRFRDALLARGSTPRYVEFDGGHDVVAWRRTLVGALRWALPPG